MIVKTYTRTKQHASLIHSSIHIHHTILYYIINYNSSYSYQVSFISDLIDTTGGQGGVEVVKILLIIIGDVCEEISRNISVFCSGLVYGLIPSSENSIDYIYGIVYSKDSRNPKNEVAETENI